MHETRRRGTCRTRGEKRVEIRKEDIEMEEKQTKIEEGREKVEQEKKRTVEMKEEECIENVCVCVWRGGGG